MKVNKSYIIALVLLIIICIASLETSKELKNNIYNKPKVVINTKSNIKLTNNQKELLHALIGLESSDMKILDNPLRIYGTYKVPQDTVLNYIKYYLKSTKNKDIQDVKVNIEEESINIKAKYKLLNAFKTPIEVSISTFVTDDSSLNLHIKDIKVLGISIEEKLTDAIVDSWFSQVEGIIVKSGDVIISNENLKNIVIKDIYFEEKELIVNLEINLE